MSTSKTTTDHSTIKAWASKRDGKPAIVKDTKSNGSGLLRINFPGFAEEGLEDVSWEQFFSIFEENKLAFLYQEEIDGQKSRFFKFVDR